MTDLTSFGPGMRVAVAGASGGIGGALTRALATDPAVARVLALSRSGKVFDHAKVESLRLDAAEEGSVALAAGAARERVGQLDLVLVAVGLLQDEARGIRPERTWRAIDPAAMLEVLRTNTVGPALIAKHFLPLLARERKSVLALVSARVGSIQDNRLGGWHSYRASKAALNMLIRCFAIELARRNPGALCVGLHPGTVDTPLSAPFQANVAESRLFAPETAAAHLLAVLDRLGAADSGKVFAWDGQPIPA